VLPGGRNDGLRPTGAPRGGLTHPSAANTIPRKQRRPAARSRPTRRP